MSGGSYNYLGVVTCDLEDLLERQGNLREMADRLAGLGYAEDAAAETEELLVMLRQWKCRAEVRIKRLRGVWHAIEWWDSADATENGVHTALAAYRGEPTDNNGGTSSMTDNAGMQLTSQDSEPGLGAVVVDSAGLTWEHVEGTYGNDYWMRTDSPDGDPESWFKVAGNYGPVRIVTNPPTGSERRP